MAAIDKPAGTSLDATVMLAGLSFILLCQLIGETVVHGLGLPLPGPVLGLLLLLILLLARDRFVLLARRPLGHDGVETASKGLLAHLSLLFVPAGVGVVQKLDLLGAMTSPPRHSISIWGVTIPCPGP